MRCRYINANGDLQFAQICAGLIKEGMVPAVTMCQHSELITKISTFGNCVQPQPETAFVPDPTPNCLFADIKEQVSTEKYVEVFEEILSWGANSLPTTSHTSHIEGVINDPSELPMCEMLLNAQAAVGGFPFQLFIVWGKHGLWSGVSEPYLEAPLINRSNDDYKPWALDFDEVYHTTIVDALEAYPEGSDLRDLINNEWPLDDVYFPTYAKKLAHSICPGYKGIWYQNALAKLNEALKWYQPSVVNIDQEYMTTASSADYYIEKILGHTPTYGVLSDDGLINCSRCNGYAGFVDNINSLGVTLRETVEANRADSLTLGYSVYDHGDWDDRYATSYWDFGSTTGYNTGQYSMYDLTYDKWGVEGTRDLYYNPVERYEEFMAAGQVAHGAHPARYYQKWTPEAPVGSYIWFSSRMDVYDSSRGYITEQMAYDMAYHLASKGAKGFAVYPQYSGKDKDPARWIPGTSEPVATKYTPEEMADDVACKMVHKAMFRAFTDYRNR